MKNNKILMLLLLVGTTILLQSCLKNEEDLFGQPSSNRMDAYLDKAKNVLTGAPNGWAFEYYPNVKQAYGGFTYTLKFNTDGTVEARKEGVAAAEKSGFSIKTDAGPVLSFDTYSNLLHEYATPSSSAYQAKQGDFEFVIDSVGEEIVKLHGKRTRNVMYLYKLTESAETYLKKVERQRSLFWYDHTEGTIGTATDRQTYDFTARQMTIGGGKVAYTFTDKGIRLFKEVALGGRMVRNFENDDAHMQLKCLDEGATDVVLKGTLSGEYFPGLLEADAGIIRINDAEISKTITMSHLKDFDVKKNGDWFTLTQEGDNVKLVYTANRTGHVRTGHIDYALGEIRGTVTIVQGTFADDVVGDYELHYQDGANTYTMKARITPDKKLYLMYGENELSMKLRVTNETIIGIESGQYMGELKNEDGTVSYCYNIFLDEANTYWTGYNAGYYYNAGFSYSEDTHEQVGHFEGMFGARTLRNFALYSFKAKKFSSDNNSGYLVRMKDPYLVKTN